MSHIPTKIPILSTIHKIHMTHHKNHYPIKNLLKPTPYISGGGGKAFVPLVGLIYLTAWLILRSPTIGIEYPVWMYYTFVSESFLFLVVSDYLHTQYHVDGSALEKFEWFRIRRERHFYHHRHLRMNMSLGGVSSTFDRAFGTFHDTSVIKDN